MEREWRSLFCAGSALFTESRIYFFMFIVIINMGDDDEKSSEVMKSLTRKSKAIEASFQNAFNSLKDSIKILSEKHKEDEDEEVVKRAKTVRDEAKRKVEKEQGKSPMGAQMREQMAKRIAEASDALQKKREKVAKEVKK